MCVRGKASGTSKTECTACVEGKSTDITSYTSTSSISTAGASGSTGSEGQTSCTDCFAGRVSTSAGREYCTLCARGKASGTSRTECTACIEGKSTDITSYTSTSSLSTAGTSTSTGTPGQTSCTSCFGGRVQPSAGQEFCTLCARGKASGTSKTVCAACVEGKSTDITTNSATSSSTPGADGSTGSEGQTSCTSCVAGRVQPSAGKEFCTRCAAGQNSAGSFTVCTECDEGKFQGLLAATTCTDCPAGFIEDSTNQNSCRTQCGAGAAGTNNAPGKYADVGNRECKNCPAGQSTAATGSPVTSVIGKDLNCVACDAGYIAVNAGLDTCVACASGRASLGSQTICSACDPGKSTTRNTDDTVADTERTAQSACLDCIEGRYTIGTASKPKCTKCPKGYKSGNSKGQTVCTECAAGKSTTTQASPDTELDGQTGCVTCKAGRYVLSTAGIKCEKCPRGYKSAGSVTVCTACSPGQSTRTELGKTNCKACPAGYVEPESAQSTCRTQCGGASGATNAGKFADEDDLVCKPCLAGRSTATDADPSIYRLGSDSFDEECVVCTDGWIQPLTGKGICTKCPVGWKSSESKLVCTKCPIGYVQPSLGKVECTKCTGPTYAKEEELTACLNCPAGYYIPSGDAGKEFHDEWEDCNACPAGYDTFYTSGLNKVANTGLTKCVACPKGWSAENTNTPTCTKCVIGEYAKKDTVAVQFFQDESSQTPRLICDDCPKGFVSVAEQDVCIVCGRGLYMDETGATKVNNNVCKNCPVGRYLLDHQDGKGINAGNTAVGDEHDDLDDCDLCPKGLYQPRPAKPRCLVCQQGRYTDTTTQTVCKKCDQGKYLLEDMGEWVDTNNGFQGGFHNDESDCKNCPMGMYTPVEANPTDKNLNTDIHGGFDPAATGVQRVASADGSGKEQKECLVCPSGYYSDVNALPTTTCKNCPIGRFILKRLTSVKVGKFQDEKGDHDEMTDCKQCRAGQYNDLAAQTDCKLCEKAKYQADAGQPGCTQCPAGRYLLEAKCGRKLATFNFNDQTSATTSPWSSNLNSLRDTERLPPYRYPSVTSGYSDNVDFTGGFEALSAAQKMRYMFESGTTKVGKPRHDCYNDETGIWKNAYHNQGNFDTWKNTANVAKTDPINEFSTQWRDDTGRDSLAACLYCEPGMYFVSQTEVCRVCPKGWIQSSKMEENAACDKCPAGKDNRYDDGNNQLISATDKEDMQLDNVVAISTGGNTMTYLQGDLLRFAHPAIENRYKKEYHNLEIDCKECPVGYHSLEGYPNCIGCPSGFYQNNAGEATESTNKPCKSCAAGKYAVGSAAGCTNCPIGSYNDAVEQGGCKHCPHGTFQTSSGVHVADTACAQCPAGRFNDLRQLMGCRQKKTTVTGIDGFMTMNGNWECGMSTNYNANKPLGKKFGSTSTGTNQNPKIGAPKCSRTPDASIATCIMARPLRTNTNKLKVEATHNDWKSQMKLRGQVLYNEGKVGLSASSSDYFATGTSEYACRAMRRDWEYATSLKSSLGAPAKTINPDEVLFTNRKFGRVDGTGPWAPSGGQVSSGSGTVPRWKCQDSRTLTENCGSTNPQTLCDEFKLKKDGGTAAGDPDGQYQSCTNCDFVSALECTTVSANKDFMDVVCGACQADLFYLNNAECSDGSSTTQAQCETRPLLDDHHTWTSVANHGFCDDYYQYRDGDGLNEDCFECPSGWYQNTPGSALCIKCAIGKHRIARAAVAEANCVNCEVGKYNEHKGQIHCKDCPKGRYNTDGQGVNLDACTRCALGKYNDEHAQSVEADACKNCPLGRIATRNRNRRQELDQFMVPGKFVYKDNNIGCTDKEPDKEGNDAHCTQEAGDSHTKYGHIGIISWEECEICKRGRYMDQEAQVRLVGGAEGANCKLCPAGTWRSIKGGTRPDHFVDDLDGAVGLVEDGHLYASGETKDLLWKITKEGTTHNYLLTDPSYFNAYEYSSRKGYDGCLSCTRGRYSRPGSAHSKDADNDSDEVAIINEDCPSCPIGWYGHEARVSDCTKCEEGKYQDQTDLPNRASGVLTGTPYKNDERIGSASVDGTTYDTFPPTTNNFRLHFPGGLHQQTNSKGNNPDLDEKAYPYDIYQAAQNDYQNIDTKLRGESTKMPTLSTTDPSDHLDSRLVDTGCNRYDTDAVGNPDTCGKTYRNYACKSCPKGFFLPLQYEGGPHEDSAKGLYHTLDLDKGGDEVAQTYEKQDVNQQNNVADCKKCPAGKYGDEYAVRSFKAGGDWAAYWNTQAGITGTSTGHYTAVTSATDSNDCLDKAVIEFGPKVYAIRDTLVKGSWNHIPSGCSVQSGSSSVHHTLHNTALSGCKNCPSGRYGMTEGRTRIESVDDSSGPNEGACSKCSKGTYSTEVGCYGPAGADPMKEPYEPENRGSTRVCSYSCRACPKGRYGSEEGNRLLEAVPQGWTDQLYAGTCTNTQQTTKLLCENAGGTWSEGISLVHWQFTHILKVDSDGKNEDDTVITDPLRVNRWYQSENAPTEVSDTMFIEVKQITLTATGGCLKCVAGQYSEQTGQQREKDVLNPNPQCMVAGNCPFEDGTNEPQQCAVGEEWCITTRNCKIPTGARDNCVNWGVRFSTPECRAAGEGNTKCPVKNGLLGACKNCPRGRYGLIEGLQQGNFYQIMVNDGEGHLMCQGCQAGYYGEEEGKITIDACKPCLKGKFLETSNDGSPNANIEEFNCKLCVEGRYGDQIALTYTKQQKDNNGFDVHTKYCKACASGKFLSTQGEVSNSACTSCPGGRFSASTSAKSSLDCNKCPTGFFGPQTGLQMGKEGDKVCAEKIGANEVTPRACANERDCAQGSVCTAKTNLTSTLSCTACGKGTFLDVFGARSEGQCKDCPPGKYNDQKGAPSENDDTKAHCRKCPIGFYQPQARRTTIETCTPCDPGKFGAKEGAETSVDCKDCLAGLYSDKTSTYDDPVIDIDCKDCPRGRWGEFASSDSLDDCELCEKGRYLENTGSKRITDCKFCSKGRFSNLVPNVCPMICGERLSDGTRSEPDGCSKCPRGKYGRDGAKFNIYCGVNGEEDCETHYCLDCPAGYYTKFAGSELCFLTDPGHYSPPGGAAMYICPMGWYGLDGTEGAGTRSKCNQCPKGRYGDLPIVPGFPGGKPLGAVGECKECSNGRYNSRIIESAAECLKHAKISDGWGYVPFQIDVAGIKHLTPSSWSTLSTIKLIEVDWSHVPAGCSIENGGQYPLRWNKNGVPLGEGKGSPSGNASVIQAWKVVTSDELGCLSCPPGRIGKEKGADELKDCEKCLTGRYQSEAGTFECNICPKGFAQDSVGSSECDRCVSGSYQNLVGKAKCLECGTGTFGCTAYSRLTIAAFGSAPKFGDLVEQEGSGATGTVVSYSNDVLVVNPTLFDFTHHDEETGARKPGAGVPHRFNSIGDITVISKSTETSQTVKCTSHILDEACDIKKQHPSPHDTTCPCLKSVLAADGNVKCLQKGQDYDGTCYGTFEDQKSKYEGMGGMNMILCGKHLGDQIANKDECMDNKIKTPRIPFESRETCALCPSGWFQSNSSSIGCIGCPIGYYTGCPGYSKCLACTSGQTTAFEASTLCVSKKVKTMTPIIVDGSLSPKKCNFKVKNYDGSYSFINDGAEDEFKIGLCLEEGEQKDEDLNPDGAVLHEELEDEEGIFSEHQMCIEWSTPPSNAMDLFQLDGEDPINRADTETQDERDFISYRIHLSYESTFPLEKPSGSFGAETNVSTFPNVTNHACVRTWFPGYMIVHFIQVLGVVGDAMGTPSVTTPLYSVAPSCGDLMYLCRRCYPPDGPGAWQVGGVCDLTEHVSLVECKANGGVWSTYNPNMVDWVCQPCPNGGDCRGPKLWKEVYSKYGYMRLGVEDFEDRKVAFWPCFKERACLGGKVDLPVGELPGTKFAYWSGPYLRALDLWSENGCPESGDKQVECNVYLDNYLHLNKKRNPLLQRPPIDCCAAVDPMAEDLNSCKEDPQNFQALSIDPGSLFVENLEYDVSYVDLMALFRNFAPESATIARTAISDEIPMSVPLGWGTVYFADSLQAKKAWEWARDTAAISTVTVTEGNSQRLFVGDAAIQMDSSTGDVLAVGTVTAVDADLSTITISSASSQMFDTSTNLAIKECPGSTINFENLPLECTGKVEMFVPKDLVSVTSITRKWNMTIGFNPFLRGCTIDLTLVDDAEECHVELGFRKHCNSTLSGKCRLCRACARGYWAQGVSNCLTCPTPMMNTILVIAAFFAVNGMLYAFLASALEDSGAEAGSTVIHFSQGMQKILLNHIQLISLASGFPLKWPDEVNEMFYWMGLFGNAGSYVFNPACQDVELVEGESMFFQKQLVILLLPFISACGCAVFWTCSVIRDKIDPPKKRWNRKTRKFAKKRARRARKLQKQNDKKLKKVRKARAKADKKIQKQNLSSAYKDNLQKLDKKPSKKPSKKSKSTTKITPVASKEESKVPAVAMKTEDGIKKTKKPMDAAKFLGDLAVAFVKKIKSLEKVEQFFKKLDSNNVGALSKKNLLPVVQSLMKKSSVTETCEEFQVVWYHLTKVCGKGDQVTLEALQKWWKSGQSSTMKDSKDQKNTLEKNYQKTTSIVQNSVRAITLEDVDEHANTLETEYQSTSAKKKKKVGGGAAKEKQPKVQAKKKKTHDKTSNSKETNTQRITRLQEEYPHLVYDPEFDHDEHVTSMKSAFEDNVMVIDFMVQPLLPLGIVWAPTKGNNKKTLVGLHATSVKKLRKKSQAGQVGLQPGDILASMNGTAVVNMDFSEVKELFRYVIDIGETYQLTFFRKVHKFKSSIHTSVKSVAMANKDEVRTWDKFIATMVSVVYLLYATVVKGTFTIVACQRVGSRMYLQMDLDIQCWESTHVWWVVHLFLPCLFGYVIGLPLVSYMILRKRKHDLSNRFTRFRYGVLYTGYTDQCWYWECVVATRKASVVAVSVFLTGAGPQTQALFAMMIIIFALTFHLLWRPYVPVTDEHHTLFWSEFWGLQTAFATFWTGLLFFQDIAEDITIKTMFTIEVLTVNFVFVMMAARWYFILKLMDLEDAVSTKKLQGFDEEDLMCANRMKSCLRKFVPEWQVVRNLWARRAWQNTIRNQILQRRIVRVFDDKNIFGMSARHKEARGKAFTLGTTELLHQDAAKKLGLVVHKKKTTDEEETKKGGMFSRRRSSKKIKLKQKMIDVHGGQEELDKVLKQEKDIKTKKQKAQFQSTIMAGQWKRQTKVQARSKRSSPLSKRKNSLSKRASFTGIDFDVLIDQLLMSFQSKIKSEYMLKQLFVKLDANNTNTLSQSQLLILVKNLANNKSLREDGPELAVVWKHLTQEQGAKTEEVTLQQLLDWHGPFPEQAPAPPKSKMKRQKSIFEGKPELKKNPTKMIDTLRNSFRGKIKSEYMLKQLFMKLDKENDGKLAAEEVIILVKNLASDKTLQLSSPEFQVVWKHLTTKCSRKTTKFVNLEQLLKWHGSFD